jgi:DNA excision repair protein ERCC-4
MSQSSPSSSSIQQQLLPFHKQILQDVVTEDTNSLLVMAKGLGIEYIISHMLRMYCDPHQLVFVIDPTEQTTLFSQLNSLLLEQGVPMRLLPKYITTAFSQSERKSIYLQGGVLFVTSRILIVDLLSREEVVPLNLVSGIVVGNAHQLTESCSESFILRLFRQRNRSAFIRGFSQDASSFTRGFGHVEYIMKQLFVQKVHLWPRFRLEVQSDLEKHEPEIVEISENMTFSMAAIEKASVNIIKSILEQLKKNNPCLDTEDFNLESSYFQNFDYYIKQQLDPIWNQIGKQSKQMIEDLKTLRRLLFYLNRYDCVTFYNYLETLRLSDGKLGIPKSYWMLSDDANDIFYYAKRRVYQVEVVNSPPPKKKQRTLTQMSCSADASSANDTPVEQVKVVLEQNPKWSLLSEILDEIETIVGKTKNEKLSGKVLVLVKDEKLANQIQQYLSMGSKKMLDHVMRSMFTPQYQRYEYAAHKSSTSGTTSSSTTSKNTAKKKTPPSKGKKTTGKGKTTKPKATSYRGKRNQKPKVAMDKQTQIKQLLDQINNKSKNIAGTSTANTLSNTFSESFQIIPHPIQQNIQSTDATEEEENSTVVISKAENLVQIILMSLANANTTRALDVHKPNFIVMYDNDLEALRRIEVYKRLHPGKPVRVYLLSYGEGSVEHQLYVTAVQRDIESFKRLIHTKAKLAVPGIDTLLSQITQIEQSTQQEVKKELVEQQRKSSGKKTTSSRRAGGATEASTSAQGSTKPQVIVDMREFRSTLPSILNFHGMDVVPVTLSVGDYIVTRDVCVERKSTSDLWQSFLSGRLFQQATNMLKHYKTATLLIQFEDKQPFVLTPRYEYKNEVDGSLITSKLVLLAIHFPRLKILWSRSPNFTAKLFHLLKSQAIASAAASSSDINTVVDTEPDATVAQLIGSGENEEESETSGTAIELLKRLPGITEQNIYTVMQNVRNLYSLSQMSLSELQNLIGKPNGKKLHEFLTNRPELEE